jgi:hypothetical protein
MNGVVVLVLICVVGSVGSIVWGFQRAQRHSPSGVIACLRRRDGRRYRVRTSASQRLTGTWNPAKPYGAGNLFGYGTGSYWMQGDQVHLEWHPKKGTSEHFVGPVPTERAGVHGNRVRGILGALGIYVAFAVAGFALAYQLSSGTSGHRAGLGAFGAIVGYFAAYFTAIVVIVTKQPSSRSDAHDPRT